MQLLRFPASPAARLTIWALAGYALWQGGGIIAGGAARWGGPSFALLRKAPGEPTVFWGTWLVVFGLVVIVASVLQLFWVKAGGLLGVATWSAMFAAGAWDAAAAVSTASNTGFKTYWLISVLALILITVDESRPMPREEPRVT